MSELMRSIIALLLATAMLSFVSAVDPQESLPEYVQRSIRPEWRLAELDDVLDQLEQIIEKPVSRSSGILEWEHAVTLIDEDKVTVLETLTVLEETQGLRFVAEPLRLIAMTETEHRQRQRRLVNLDLRDYGLFITPPDFGGPIISYDEAGGGASPFDFDGEEELPFDIEDLVGIFRSDTDVEKPESDLRGRGNLMVLVTEEEERAMRAVLGRLYQILIRRSAWRVHFGLLPRDIEFRGGVLPGAEAQAIAEQLDERETLQLSGMNGQLVTAGGLGVSNLVVDVEVNQTGRFPVLNPVVRRRQTGKSVDLKAFIGLDHVLLEFHASWTETLGDRTTRPLRRPPTIDPAHVFSRATGTKKANSVGVSSSASLEPAHVEPGLRIDMERQTMWYWQPRGEVFIPRDHALVLAAERDGRRLAIVIEEVK